MRIAGIQKLTTVDYPGHLAATLFLAGCDLRCGFCHNPDLVKNVVEQQSQLTTKDVLDVLRAQCKFIDGVCITGGEPLLTLDIAFVREIKKLGLKVKLDTNGFHPQKLKALIDENLLDYVAIDLKTLPTLYHTLVGRRPNIDAFMQSVRLAAQLPEYEFRTTMIPGYHNTTLLESMINWLMFTTGKHRLHAFYLQQFVPRLGKMISADYDKLPITSSKLLTDCFEVVKNSFDICEVRRYYDTPNATSTPIPALQMPV